MEEGHCRSPFLSVVSSCFGTVLSEPFYTAVVQLSSRRGDTYCHLQDELCQDDGVEDEVLGKALGVWGMLNVAGSGQAEDKDQEEGLRRSVVSPCVLVLSAFSFSCIVLLLLFETRPCYACSPFRLGTPYVAMAVLKLMTVPQPQPPECSACRHRPTYLALFCLCFI